MTQSGAGNSGKSDDLEKQWHPLVQPHQHIKCLLCRNISMKNKFGIKSAPGELYWLGVSREAEFRSLVLFDLFEVLGLLYSAV